MAYTVMAYIVMAYIVMAHIVMAYIVMAYIVMAYIVMGYIFMAYIVMAYRCVSKSGLNVCTRGASYWRRLTSSSIPACIGASTNGGTRRAPSHGSG